MTSRSSMKNYWSGFFIGDKRPIDALGVFVIGDRMNLMDGHVTSFGNIKIDNITNVQPLKLQSQDRVLTAEFARPLTAIDSFDVDLSSCVTFFLPTNTLKLDENEQMSVPQRMSKRRVCNIVEMCSINEQQRSFKKRSNPSVCEYTNGRNTVRWKSIGGGIDFFIEQNIKPGKWWSAVGVGESMKNMKAMIAFMENGNVMSIGGYQTQGYETPKPDPMIKPNSKINNGRSIVNFALPMNVIDLYTKTPVAVLVCGIQHCSNKNLAFVEDMVPEIEQKGCKKDHTDLYICESYFNNYLYDVAEWAKKHGLVLEEHLWKLLSFQACMLLSLVERVPTQCCTKFQYTCNSYLEFMRSRI
ncbi:hypothetical protein DICVIV_00572 [Dictyocaulus viviparus]|uniref:DOMON domain-containing protein n=1 Tax=Dictyocaulus viviparus TaxID=29172 RepID=A0A0D8YF47_DICVI|nr:hypothetical protein DICVIV_00572 [Dictyocaulus viviparus]